MLSVRASCLLALISLSAAHGRSLSAGASHQGALVAQAPDADTPDPAAADAVPVSTLGIPFSSSPYCHLGHCLCEMGETWLLDTSIEVESLTIRGTLIWDTSKDGLELKAGYVLVESGGNMTVGTAERPMQYKAIINLTDGGRSHYMLGQRFLGSHGPARVQIHGRPLQRTWTTLSRTAWAGSSQLFLKHDPLRMGWRPGDRIGLATTMRGDSTEHIISRIGGATEWPLTFATATAGVEVASWNELATNAVDGVMRTRWGSWCAPNCDGGSNQWLQVSFSNSSYVTRAIITWDTLRYAPEYEIRCIYSGQDTLGASVTGSVGGREEVAINKNCDHLKIVANFESMNGRGPHGTEPAWSGLWLYEVQAYGQMLGEEIPMVVHLQEPLADEHYGGVRTIEGREFEIAAEVVNLERNVLITGDDADFDSTQKGIHTIMAGNGVWDVRFARVEHCGQRDNMGRYCMHLHLSGNCTECRFHGNAIVDSHQVGITLHGVHGATVSENTLWNVRAAGIYTEDGNEMNNLIAKNVVICKNPGLCNVPWLGKVQQSAGIYLVGMTNDLVENRVAGYLHGLWFAGSANSNGQGRALNRVCPTHTPLGTVRGNVNHDNSNFGLYMDQQHPRKLERDENGFVTNMGSCAEFTAEGKDNGIEPANVVEDELDYHNMFVGQYACGDITFLRYRSVNNAHGMYWKLSKNFADGASYHILDSTFANDWTDPYGMLQLLGPAGPFTFLMKNTSFVGGPVGCGAVCAGQHCGRVGAGGPCDVQYVLEDIDWSALQEGSRKIKFGVNSVDVGFVQPIFTSLDNSLGGHKSLVSQHLNGFKNVAGCTELGAEWDHAYGCDVAIRRLNIWSPTDMGFINISGPGYDNVEANWESPTGGMNAGYMPYEPLHSGYGTPVIVGENYQLNATWRGSLAVEFSDHRIADGVPEAVNVTLDNLLCELFAADPRDFLGATGPQAGVVVPAMQKCKVPRTAEPVEVTTTTTTTQAQSGMCEPEATVPCCPDGSCRETCAGGAHCCPGNITCPSASVVQVPTCGNGKRFDCTNMTGVTPPGRLAGACAWPNEPGAPYYWDPWCSAGVLGCWADGKNAECRFCGVEPWDSVICPRPTTMVTTTTTVAPERTTTTSVTTTRPRATCAGLQDSHVERSCSADGCTVLTGGIANRTCATFCAGADLACLGAWEELGGGCELGEELPCNSPRPDTADLICRCEPAIVTTTRTTTLADGLGQQILNTGPGGICLQAPQVNVEGVEVNMWTCDGSAGQQWRYSPETLRIENLDGLCLDSPAVHTNGALVRMWPCHDGDSYQEWVYNEETGQIKALRGKCLDASKRSTPGGKVHLWSCNELNLNQQWGLSATPATTTAMAPVGLDIIKAVHGLCLLAPESRGLGTEVVMWPCNRTDAREIWAYDWHTGLIRNRGGLCLDASQRSTNGGRVHMWSCDTANLNQQWDYNMTTNSIRNRHGICLDASRRNVEGGKVHMWTCIDGVKNQEWEIMHVSAAEAMTVLASAPQSMPFETQPLARMATTTPPSDAATDKHDSLSQLRSVSGHGSAGGAQQVATADGQRTTRRRRRSFVGHPVLDVQ